MVCGLGLRNHVSMPFVSSPAKSAYGHRWSGKVRRDRPPCSGSGGGRGISLSPVPKQRRRLRWHSCCTAPQRAPPASEFRWGRPPHQPTTRPGTHANPATTGRPALRVHVSCGPQNTFSASSITHRRGRLLRSAGKPAGDLVEEEKWSGCTIKNRRDAPPHTRVTSGNRKANSSRSGPPCGG